MPVKQGLEAWINWHHTKQGSRSESWGWLFDGIFATSPNFSFGDHVEVPVGKWTIEIACNHRHSGGYQIAINNATLRALVIPL